MKMVSSGKCTYMALSREFLLYTVRRVYRVFIFSLLGCYSSSKDSDTQSIVGCPDDAPYCLNSLTNYVNGKTEVEKV